MFGLSSKFYLQSIAFLDAISAVGLSSTKKTFVNRTKLLYSIFISLLYIVAAVAFFRPFNDKRDNTLLYNYLTYSALSTLVLTAALIVKVSLQSVNKKKALLAVKLIHLRIKKHSISASKSTVLDFCKELVFIMQLSHAALHITSMTWNYYNVADDKLNIAQLSQWSAFICMSFLHISMHYSFTMLNLLSLESFNICKEEILASAHPKNMTLSINKTVSPVDQTFSSVFTIRPQPGGWFKDIRTKQIRTMITDYCILEDIRTFTNYWHSVPLTYLLFVESTYIPTLPVHIEVGKDRSVIQEFILLVLLLTVLSTVASNVYYRYTKYKLRSSLSTYIYRSSDVQVQRQLINLQLFLNRDLSADHWKWHTIDFSLLGTIFDTSVLILTSFLAEIVY